MDKFSQQTMLGRAYTILDKANTPMSFTAIIDEVFKECNIEENTDLRVRLYLEMTSSGLFVYLGNDEWDIKAKHSLKEYNHDAVDYMVTDKSVIIDDDIDYDDSYIDDDEEELDEYDEEEAPYSYDDEKDSRYSRAGFGNEDEDYDDDFDKDYDENEDSDDFDESNYNDIMDDYEDMYDK